MRWQASPEVLVLVLVVVWNIKTCSECETTRCSDVSRLVITWRYSAHFLDQKISCGFHMVLPTKPDVFLAGNELTGLRGRDTSGFVELFHRSVRWSKIQRRLSFGILFSSSVPSTTTYPRSIY